MPSNTPSAHPGPRSLIAKYRVPRIALFALGTFVTAGLAVAAPNKSPIAIAEITRAEPVNFDRDVLPFLSDNCLACHCKTTKKGGLDLESPALMLKGGENGPAIVPGKAADSPMLQAAAHLDEDLLMPPADNKAKAHDLTSQQLGLLRLWIDQGAKESPKIERPIQWQPLAQNLGAIFAVAVTADGQFAACSRENRISIYRLTAQSSLSGEAGHRDQVNALAFSPDGTLLASGGYREVKLWRRTPDLQKPILTHAGTPSAVSPDGQSLAIGDSDGNASLWALPAGTATRTLAVAKGPLTALKFSPDGSKLVVAAKDKSLTLWNTSDGQPVARAEASADTTSLAWLPDGKQLATAGTDGVIRLWTDALAPATELKGHTGAVTSLEAASPNRLVSGSADGSLRVWEIDKEQSLVQMSHGAPITAVAVRADGQRFASAGADNGVKLWSADAKQIAELRGNRYLKEIVDERDRASQIASGNVAYSKQVEQNAEKLLKDAQDRVKKSADAVAPKQQDLQAKEKALTDALYAKDGLLEALVAADAAAMKAAEDLQAAEKAVQQAKADAEALKAASPPDQPAIDKAVALLAAKTEESANAKAARDQREAERKQATDKIEPARKKLAEAEAAEKKAATARTVAETELTLAQDDEKKKTAGVTEGKAGIETAEAALASATAELQAARKTAAEGEQPIRTVAFSPDGQTLATAGDDRLVHSWNAETGAPLDVYKGHGAPVVSLAFAANGNLVSADADGAAFLRNLHYEWKLERVIGTGDAGSPLPDRVNALAFSHDGKLLATGSGEPSRGGDLALWDSATGALVRDLPNVHSDTIFALAFSPDDHLLASGAADRMARIVEVASGKILRTFEGHSHHVLAVNWSPDGRTLATAGADNLVKLWDAATGERKKNIEGYDKEVTAVSFAGVTGNLLTGSGDNRVRLISADGKELRAFSEVPDYVEAAAITPDGKLVIAGGQDSVLRIWNAADGAKVAAFPPAK